VRADDVALEIRDLIDDWRVTAASNVQFLEGSWNELIFTDEAGIKFLITVEEYPKDGNHP